MRETVAATSLQAIHRRLAQPLQLQTPRATFLKLFPLPVGSTGQGAQTGDERRLRFVYAKWIWWNLHEGEARFRIERLSPTHLRYVPVADTSYLSSYLRWTGVDLVLEPVGAQETRVRLALSYHRNLDPAWYFGPMQRYAVGLATELLIQSIAGDAGASAQ